jgi:hypothetical protein
MLESDKSKKDLEFVLVSPAESDSPSPDKIWIAKDHWYAFKIVHEDAFLTGFAPCVEAFVVYISWLDGTDWCQVGRLKTFEAAVQLCWNFTRDSYRAYHEAGHAVVAKLLGFEGVFIDMKFRDPYSGAYSSVTAYDGDIRERRQQAAVDNDDHEAFARYWRDQLTFVVAGLVAGDLAGYRTAYVEADCTGVPLIPRCAVRAARTEAGLPICNHRDCEILLDDAVTAERIAAVTKRAEDEARVLLKANWSTVERVTNALRKRNRLTAAELDAVFAGRRAIGAR